MFTNTEHFSLEIPTRTVHIGEFAPTTPDTPTFLITSLLLPLLSLQPSSAGRVSGVSFAITPGGVLGVSLTAWVRLCEPRVNFYPHLGLPYIVLWERPRLLEFVRGDHRATD